MTTTNIIHLGDFWKQLVLSRPSDYFRAGNTLLLCLNAEGLLLNHFFLSQDAISSRALVIQACLTLAKGIGTSTVVRIQAHQDYKTAPSTDVLYKTAHFYGLHLVEVIPLRFTQ